jgi:hypothetical protein
MEWICQSKKHASEAQYYSADTAILDARDW